MSCRGLPFPTHLSCHFPFLPAHQKGPRQPNWMGSRGDRMAPSDLPQGSQVEPPCSPARGFPPRDSLDGLAPGKGSGRGENSDQDFLVWFLKALSCLPKLPPGGCLGYSHSGSADVALNIPRAPDIPPGAQSHLSESTFWNVFGMKHLAGEGKGPAIWNPYPQSLGLFTDWYNRYSLPHQSLFPQRPAHSQVHSLLPTPPPLWLERD